MPTGDLLSDDLGWFTPVDLELLFRVCNLEVLTSKRDRNGLAQAEVAIHVAKMYLQHRIADNEVRDALKGTKLIAELANSKAGRFVWDKWEIDVMQAVDPLIFPVDEFREKEWPKQMKRTADARKRLKTMHENRKAARRTISTRR